MNYPHHTNHKLRLSNFCLCQIYIEGSLKQLIKATIASIDWKLSCGLVTDFQIFDFRQNREYNRAAMMTNTTDPITRAGKRKLTSSGSDVWLDSWLFLGLGSEFRPCSPGVFNLCILLLLWRRGIAVTDLCKELPGHNQFYKCKQQSKTLEWHCPLLQTKYPCFFI